MSVNTIAIIYFFYGLSFFSMGLAILLEYSKCTDERLRHALRPLSAFGLIHGGHEWIEMFILLGIFTVEEPSLILLESVRIGLLAYSFLSLAAFGSSLLAKDEAMRRISLLLPLLLSAIWAFGLLILRGHYAGLVLFSVADVWTRYVLALPAALFACAGLIVQQRRFRQAGLARFGRDSLWAAIAFFWYGVIGQTFSRATPLPPSNIINQTLFSDVFGFPVQLLRAIAALVAAVFVIRFLRAFEVEMQAQIAALQASRLQEAERREAQRGELLRRVVQAQEAERQRVGRELHDETGQSLTAIGLGLRGVTNTIFQDPDKAASQLKQLQGLVAHSMTELQRLISDLRPSHLDDLGLTAALRWYAGEVEKRTGLKVHFEVKGEPQEITSEAKTALFRVVQEALTNTIKHAYAQNVSIQLSYGVQAVTVIVRDDGRGFDMRRPGGSNRPSWGLIGMRERASLLGGSLEVQSQVGQGTQVKVVIPYRLPEEEGDEDTGHVGG